MSDRHPKWRRVEPGTVIPAGQPYRAEHQSVAHRAEEGVHPANHEVYSGSAYDWFVDSSWRPPLELPTEPTWGIALHTKYQPLVRRFHLEGDEFLTHLGGSYRAHNVTDFIPLTDEQVERIEAAQPSKFPSQEDAFR